MEKTTWYNKFVNEPGIIHHLSLFNPSYSHPEINAAKRQRHTTKGFTPRLQTWLKNGTQCTPPANRAQAGMQIKSSPPSKPFSPLWQGVTIRG